MKSVLLTTAALLGLAVSLPALAQVPTTEPPPAERPPVIIRTEPSEEFEEAERERERPTLQGLTTKQRLRYGANFDIPSLSFFGGSSFLNLGVSPMIGYRVRYGTTVGVGATISYTSQPDYYSGAGRLKITSGGGRLFLQQHLTFLDEKIPGLFLWAEGEQMKIISYRDGQGNRVNNLDYKPGFLVGGGYGAVTGEPGFQITVLYHTGVDAEPNAYPYGSPLVFRIGWWFK
jgi:hypothetical protein